MAKSTAASAARATALSKVEAVAATTQPISCSESSISMATMASSSTTSARLPCQTGSAIA